MGTVKRKSEMIISEIEQMNIDICEFFIGKDEHDLKYISDAQKHFEGTYDPLDVRNTIYSFVDLQLIWQASGGRYARYITMQRGRKWIEFTRKMGFEV